MSDKIPSDEEVRNAYAHTYAKTRTAGMQHQQVWLDEQQRINGLAEFYRWLAEHDREVKATERRRIMRKVRSVLGDSGAFGFLGEFEGVLDSIEHEVSK